MPFIPAPSLQVGQPQSLVQLDPRHPLYPDIVFAYSSGRGYQDGKFNVPGLVTGAITSGAGARGKHVKPSDSSSYIGYADRADYNTLGGLTIIAGMRPTGFSSQQAIVTKCETNGGSNTPFGFFTEVGGAISLNRSNVGGGTPFRVWTNSYVLTAGVDTVIAVTQGADISVDPKFYVNGIFDTGAAINLYAGTGSGAPTANTTSVKIGNRTDLGSQCFHDLYDVLVVRRVLSGVQIAQLSRNIHQVWKAPDRKIWVAAAGSSGTVAKTDANDTSAASGSTTVTGTLAKTAANDTASASGTTVVTGSLARTSANDSVAASGSTTVTGSSSTANASDTLAASGSVGSAVTGTVSRTNANDSVTASGATTVTGSLARTNASDSLSAVGSVGSAVSGAVARTDANDGASASGTTTVIGNLAKTSANDSLSANGSVGSTVGGTVARTNASDTASATGTTTIVGSVAKSDVSDTSAGVGTTAVVGAVARTGANDSLIASGTTSIIGWLAKTSASDTLAAIGAAGSGPPPIAGPAGSGPRLRIARGHRPGMRNTSRPAQLR